MTLDQINERIEDLTSKIPIGTECTEDNCCGGYLSAEEDRELNGLFYLQSMILSDPDFEQGLTVDCICVKGIGPTLEATLYPDGECIMENGERLCYPPDEYWTALMMETWGRNDRQGAD